MVVKRSGRGSVDRSRRFKGAEERNLVFLRTFDSVDMVM